MIKIDNVTKSQVAVSLDTASQGFITRFIGSEKTDYVEDQVHNLAQIKDRYKDILVVSMVTHKTEEPQDEVVLEVVPEVVLEVADTNPEVTNTDSSEPEKQSDVKFNIGMETKKAGRGLSRTLVVTTEGEVDLEGLQFTTDSEHVSVNSEGKVFINGKIESDVTFTATVGEMSTSVVVKQEDFK